MTKCSSTTRRQKREIEIICEGVSHYSGTAMVNLRLYGQHGLISSARMTGYSNASTSYIFEFDVPYEIPRGQRERFSLKADIPDSPSLTFAAGIYYQHRRGIYITGKANGYGMQIINNYTPVILTIQAAPETAGTGAFPGGVTPGMKTGGCSLIQPN